MKNLLLVFKDAGKISWPIVIVFVVINGIVLYNAIFHDPGVQYDSTGHLANIGAIAAGHLPSEEESGEYFSAPLAYLLPALIVFAGKLDALEAAGIAQLFNFILSLGLTLTLLKIADELFPGRPYARLIALGMLAILPVYYRTFAYVRGEPFVAFLTVLAVYQTLQVFYRDRGGWPGVIALGLTLGLDILARQWAFFFFPALFVFGVLCVWRGQARFTTVLARIVVVTLLAALAGGWFYLSLYKRFGTLTAFNRPAGDQLLTNQPASFYIDPGLEYLFSKPVRPWLNNRLVPILYSDTWGDYWGYFLVYVTDVRNGARSDGVNFDQALSKPSDPWILINYDSIGAYLGEVNLVSIAPTVVFLAGLLFALWELLDSLKPQGGRPLDGSVLLTLGVIATLGGYFWFLVAYPVPKAGGDTIKASYILPVYPLCALLVANLFEKVAFLRSMQKWLWGLGPVWLYNLPTLFTHYPILPWK